MQSSHFRLHAAVRESCFNGVSSHRDERKEERVLPADGDRARLEKTKPKKRFDLCFEGTTTLGLCSPTTESPRVARKVLDP